MSHMILSPTKDMIHKAMLHPLCIIPALLSKASSVEHFEDIPQQALVFGHRIHGLDIAEDQRQGRRPIFAQFVDDLLECLQIP